MYNDDFRTFVLGLPETKEGQHAGLPTFLVRGRRFAALGWPDPHKIAVALSLEEQDLLLTTCPLVVEQAAGAWGRRGHTHLDLGAADEATACSVIIMAWCRCAPPHLAKSFQ
jgi:hypothetical protein